MLIRAEFEELQPVKYISHLELMATFRRAFRRADLPLAYSQGFNPHIILSLGQPLKVGMIGRGEYFDLELAEDIDINTFINSVNDNLPEGIKILRAELIPSNTKSLMATINTAVYIFDMIITDDNLKEQEMINKFLSEREIRVIRHRRNKEDRELDIRPLIYDGRVIEAGRWAFRVKCGSTGNLRSEELIRALANYFNDVELIPLINIEREGLYINLNDDKFYDPFDDNVIGS